MKLNKNLVFFLLLLSCFSASGQVEKGYYLFPINPGQQNFLAGNMSEIRSNHFHSGLDIKTEGRQGLPVHAAADGYVQKIKVSSFGYGNVLFLKHPNGQYTVYAHLKDFAPKIAQYIWQKMAEAKQNSLEVILEPGVLRVSKGDTIAYSGNTGSSGGPHLHFEIRDSLERALDPLKFGFDEIKDSTPPIIADVALSPLEYNSRINGKFERTELRINYRGNKFVVDQPVTITGKVGIEIRGYDKLDGMYNPNGFPLFKIYESGKQTFEIDVDKIDFEIGRFVLRHTYRNRYTKLYRVPNNPFDFYYPDSVFSGAIQVEPDSTKDVKVEVQDAYGNTSLLELQFKGEKEEIKSNGSYPGGSLPKIENHNKWMVLHAPLEKEGKLAMFYVNGFMMDVQTAYESAHHRTYLWDLNYGIPDSVDVCTSMVYPEVEARIPFQEEIYYTNGKTSIQFDKNTLLDDLFLRVNYKEFENRPALEINDEHEYLRNPMEVSMSTEGFEGDTSKLHVYQLYPNGWKAFLGGKWGNDHIRFNTKKFGTFVLDRDDSPPTIRPIRINSSQLRFYIRDDLSGIKDFKLCVNGEWVILRYEHKHGVIWTEKLNNKPFKGKIELSVTDNANNTERFIRNL
ncbi:M23 family metallopeptidase [Echinicola jeungdonensis]|uniref:M23 family metallopeptidase n=1 Tax=Echinicola jeungdonensis TaxID=709343 RepID=A0ABV5J5U3_9BACT|nr:M23 family metallopeptidase [Echinicola jeungdonensis]MDN3670964.1 M23 family metallopeptidase [Echinicola jeungdonensis]